MASSRRRTRRAARGGRGLRRLEAGSPAGGPWRAGTGSWAAGSSPRAPRGATRGADEHEGAGPAGPDAGLLADAVAVLVQPDQVVDGPAHRCVHLSPGRPGTAVADDQGCLRPVERFTSRMCRAPSPRISGMSTSSPGASLRCAASSARREPLPLPPVLWPGGGRRGPRRRTTVPARRPSRRDGGPRLAPPHWRARRRGPRPARARRTGRPLIPVVRRDARAVRPCQTSLLGDQEPDAVQWFGEFGEFIENVGFGGFLGCVGVPVRGGAWARQDRCRRRRGPEVCGGGEQGGGSDLRAGCPRGVPRPSAGPSGPGPRRPARAATPPVGPPRRRRGARHRRCGRRR